MLNEGTEMRRGSNVEVTEKHQIPFSDIEVEKELGRGSYGRVCLGRWSGTLVALKFCREAEKLEEFLNETKLMVYDIKDRKQTRIKNNSMNDHLHHLLV